MLARPRNNRLHDVTRVRGHHLHAVVHHKGKDKHILFARPGKLEEDHIPSIPQTLLFRASWIYNFTTGKILKNKTGQSVVPVMDAEEVDEKWLLKNGFAVRPVKW